MVGSLVMAGRSADHFDALVAVIGSRHMVRDFTPDTVSEETLDTLLDLARRAPSAGHTQPWEFLVLRGARVARYWAVTLGERQAGFRWQGLVHAPVLVVPYVRPEAYVARYAEADKATTGLGSSRADWSVPYWWVDGGAAVQNLLLAVTAAGLGACLFGQFDHESAVRAAFGVPDDRRAVGTIALGHPAPSAPGRSAARIRPDLATVVHRDRWND